MFQFLFIDEESLTDKYIHDRDVDWLKEADGKPDTVALIMVLSAIIRLFFKCFVTKESNSENLVTFEKKCFLTLNTFRHLDR